MTRAKLMAAATQVVAMKGYAHATTRDIAEVAGVAEGTLYRHFASKYDLFFAALHDRHAEVISTLSALPSRAGSDTVSLNLAVVCNALARLRDDVIPLELALASDPEARRRRDEILAGGTFGVALEPHDLFAAYLSAEQALGRVRPEIDPTATSLVILATLFGVGLLPTTEGGPEFAAVLDAAIALIVAGVVADDRPPPRRSGTPKNI